MKLWRIRLEAICNGEILMDTLAMAQHVDATCSLLLRRSHVGLPLSEHHRWHGCKQECQKLKTSGHSSLEHGCSLRRLLPQND
jgi:hypothetical protein